MAESPRTWAKSNARSKKNEDDNSGLEIAFQVVEKVNKALLSVNHVFAQGHDVVFSEAKGHFLLLDEIPMM